MSSKTYDLSIHAPNQCPQFQRCSYNDCPLETKKYRTDPSDRQTKCKVAKNIRKRIAKAYGLKNLGLKPRELSAMRKWDNLPEAEKKRRINKLKKLSPVSRCLEKGLVVSRKSKSKLSNTRTKQETLAVDASNDIISSYDRLSNKLLSSTSAAADTAVAAESLGVKE